MNISIENLPLFEALSSETRLRIIELLVKDPLNVKELSLKLGISSAMVVQHLNKLEAGGVIRSEKVSWKGVVQRRSFLIIESLDLEIPGACSQQKNNHYVSVPIGHFADCKIEPTCGLATTEHVIGVFDDPRYFFSAERVHAAILWFAKGYVEYRVPNFLTRKQRPTALEILMEIGSEAPGVNSDWPSDIYFNLNGKELGCWTCPGDFADRRGRYTPPWWSSGIGQYGIMKVIRITEDGGWIDGQPLNTNLKEVSIDKRDWTFRISVPDYAVNVGGVTLYGKGFGNHMIDIVFKLYYEA